MENVLSFFREIGKLKNVERTGWVLEGVKEPESVADHSFRAAIMTLVLGKNRQDIDVNKAVKMALIHDIAESQIGDVIVDWKLKAHGNEKLDRIKHLKDHGVSQDEKTKKEKEGMEFIASLLGEDGKEILRMWIDFENKGSKEAKFVRSVEKFETFLQAFEYEKAQSDVDISAWFDHENNWKDIEDDEVRKFALEIVRKRNK